MTFETIRTIASKQLNLNSLILSLICLFYNCFVTSGLIFSERELMFTLYVVVRPSVCRLSVYLSVVCLSVTFVHPTQPIEIFGNVSAPFNTLVT